MGPLVPDIISNEFNLIIAFLLGIGFGFTLEQAGFSSTKKLVGLFYGYDFTVLKVFFTAGVTALIGVLLLYHVGLLDLNLIYINPTFLWAALVGGGIMGAGFIIGGFCPGTSICAAAIGKIDAMFFVLGSVLGISIFTEAYPILEKLYKAENWGPVRMDQFFSISPELFAFILTFIAVFAFFAVTQIENRVNKRKSIYSKKGLVKYASLAILPFLFIAVVSLTPNKQEYIQQQITKARQQQKCTFKEIPSDKLAYELVNNHYNLNLIDVRNNESFKKYHLPLAINIPLEEMTNREWTAYFDQSHKINVFYADVDTMAKKACLLARFIGKSENYILKESTNEFKQLYFELEPPLKDAPKMEFDTYKFRSQAAADLINLENALKKFSQPIKKKTRKIVGGCS
jgi:rhodanese-related sulfurtransferase